MKNLILLLIFCFPFIANASENIEIETKIEKIEKIQAEYKNTWEISKKIFDYYDAFIFILIAI